MRPWWRCYNQQYLYSSYCSKFSMKGYHSDRVSCRCVCIAVSHYHSIDIFQKLCSFHDFPFSRVYTASQTIQAMGSWAWYCRYPNHPYRGHFLSGGFLIGLFAAAYCMPFGGGTARYLLLLSPCVSALVLCCVIFKELYLGQTGLRDGAFLQIERPAEEVK
jgi:hypothetical protein